MRPYTEVVSAKKILNTNLGPIGSLDSLVIKQIAQLSNPYSGVFSISRPTVILHLYMKKNYFLSQIFKILFSIFIFAQGQSNNNSFFLSQILVFFLGCFLRHFFSSLKLKYGVVDDLLLYVFCFLSLSLSLFFSIIHRSFSYCG